MLSILTTKPKLIIALVVGLLIAGLFFRVYQLNTKVEVLTAQMTTLETEKVSIQERLAISNANNDILNVNVATLQEHIAEADRECEARVARAASKTKVIEKRTYIPKQDAIDKGVLDETSNKMLLEYLGTYIFN